MFFSASGARFKDGFDGVSWLVVRNSVKNLGLTLFPVGLTKRPTKLPVLTQPPKTYFHRAARDPRGRMIPDAHKRSR